MKAEGSCQRYLLTGFATVLLLSLLIQIKCEDIDNHDAPNDLACDDTGYIENECDFQDSLKFEYKVKFASDIMPWLVSLQDYRYDNPRHFCGGVIIDETSVLTTGFCVWAYKPQHIKVVAGEFDMRNVSGWEQVMNLEEIIIHENFNSFSHSNDIAIMKTTVPFSFNQKVSPLSLFNNFTRPVGEVCRTNGWRMIEKSGIIHPLLKEVKLNIISSFECRKKYPGLIKTSNICASTKGIESPCTGDWGGPLICENEEFVGIASWSNGCGKDFPVVFLRIDSYISWIEGKSGTKS